MEPVTRTVDTDSYMRVLSGLVAKGETVCLTITGGSMTPFLVHGRDSIRFAKPSGPLRRGDMAFYRRRNGQYVMHRIVRVDRQGNYYAAGDAQTEIEGPLAPDMVFAVVTDVCRKGKWIKKGNFWCMSMRPSASSPRGSTRNPPHTYRLLSMHIMHSGVTSACMPMIPQRRSAKAAR